MKIISREQAKAQNLKFFFTGKQCKNGHICERYSAEGSCVICTKTQGNVYRSSRREQLRKDSQIYREKNRTVILEKRKIVYHSKDVIDRKLSKLKCLFNLDREDYLSILISQNNRCAICNRHENEFKRSLSVDHNHITCKVRGLLCSNCNTAIGLLKENVEVLECAKKYLLKYSD